VRDGRDNDTTASPSYERQGRGYTHHRIEGRSDSARTAAAGARWGPSTGSSSSPCTLPSASVLLDSPRRRKILVNGEQLLRQGGPQEPHGWRSGGGATTASRRQRCRCRCWSTGAWLVSPQPIHGDPTERTRTNPIERSGIRYLIVRIRLTGRYLIESYPHPKMR
jgi:hypothetical protein